VKNRIGVRSPIHAPTQPAYREDAIELSAGTFVRWIEPARRTKPLGIVLAPVTPDMIYVLMADREGKTDVEAFVARREATGVDASAMVLESLETVEDGDPELTTFLRRAAPLVESELAE
jgi:hypothetical protein